VTQYAVPIMPSRNLRETLEFYERLGFELRGAPPETYGYLIVGRGSLIELHFWESSEVDPLTTDHSCYVRVADADELYAGGKRSEFLPIRRPAAGSCRQATPTTGCASSRSSTRAATSSGSARRQANPR
jgi:hypothetical protein